MLTSGVGVTVELSCIRSETAFGRGTAGGGRRAGGGRQAAALIVLSDAAPGVPWEILAAAATPTMSGEDTNAMKWPYIAGFQAHTDAAPAKCRTRAAGASSLLISRTDPSDSRVEPHNRKTEWPMCLIDRPLCIVYDREIYRYRIGQTCITGAKKINWNSNAILLPLFVKPKRFTRPIPSIGYNRVVGAAIKPISTVTIRQHCRRSGLLLRRSSPLPQL